MQLIKSYETLDHEKNRTDRKGILVTKSARGRELRACHTECSLSKITCFYLIES